MLHRHHEGIAVGHEDLLDVDRRGGARRSDVVEHLLESRTRKSFSRYMSQYTQRFHEQPTVAWRMYASASLGGR